MLSNDVTSGEAYAQIGPISGEPGNYQGIYQLGDDPAIEIELNQPGGYADFQRPFISPLNMAPGSVHNYEVVYGGSGLYSFLVDGNTVYSTTTYTFNPTQAGAYGETHDTQDQMYGDTASNEQFSGTLVIPAALDQWEPIDVNNQATVDSISSPDGVNFTYHANPQFGSSVINSSTLNIWDYACPAHMMAFTSQGSTQYLQLQNTSNGAYTEPDTMQPGTSPSVAQLTDGSYVVAFQGQDGDLCMYMTANGQTNCTNLGMDSSTSDPSVAALPNSQFIIAFRVNTNALWLWSGNESGSGSWVNTQEPLMANTNPAIAATTNGGWVAAFQMNNGYLYTYYNGTAYGSGLGMQSGTSPAMTSTASGGWEAAFEANANSGNHLFWFQPSGQWTNTNQGMASNASPSMSQLTDGSFVVAFENSSDYLNIWNSGSLYYSYPTLQPMWGGTNPGIVGTGEGGEWVDFMASSSHLEVWSLQNGLYDTGRGIWGGTSPAIAN